MATLRRRDKALALAITAAAVLLVALPPRTSLSRVGLPYSYHWDEPVTLNNAVAIAKSGNWNPQFFNYGSLSIYLTVPVVSATYAYSSRLPSGHPDHIASWDELIAGEPDFEWYISHPRFLQSSRWITIVFGLASCLTLLGLGYVYGRPIVGVVAALLLATSRFHVEMSSLLTPNVPASTCALLALCTAALALKRDSTRLAPWIMAGVFCGLAGSFKYNFGVVSIVVFAAMLLSRLPKRTKVVATAILPLTVIVAFLLGTPYAVLDFPGFLEGVRYELNHYLVESSDIGAVAPGLSHLWLDLSLISKDFGLPILLLGGFGVWVLARSVRGGWVLPAGAALIVGLTATTSVGFHRNVVLAYPIIALCVAVGGGALMTRFKLDSTRTRRTLLLAGFAGLVVFRLTVVYDWLETVLRPDPRTTIVEEVNALAGVGRLVVAEELRLHRQDLDRFHVPVQTKPLKELFCDPTAEDTSYLLPARLASGHPSDAAQVAALNRALEGGVSDAIVRIGDGQTRLRRLSFWPGVALANGAGVFGQGLPLCSDTSELALTSSSTIAVVRNSTVVAAGERMAGMQTDLAAGEHELKWCHQSSGMTAATVRLKIVGHGIAIDRQLRAPKRFCKQGSQTFTLPSRGDVYFEFRVVEPDGTRVSINRVRLTRSSGEERASGGV